MIYWLFIRVKPEKNNLQSIPILYPVLLYTGYSIVTYKCKSSKNCMIICYSF